ncbi:MAG: ATP-dependent DNA helicase RecG [Proteobacteria bacterium]|nr:MAG: ATP-dependent DNA helicase RecG [Pseudomonadota bacterium]
MTDIASPGLDQLKGVGPRLREKLARLGVSTLQDLLFHLPTRYQDRTTVHDAGALRIGNEVVVQGRIVSCRIHFGRRRSLLTEIRDDTGVLLMRQFHFSRAQQNALEHGAWVRCFGEVRRGPRALEMVHPEYTVFDAEPPPVEGAGGWTPVYPTTQGLGQTVIRRLVDQALARVDDVAEELLPEALLNANRFPAIGDALRTLHHPESEFDASGALRHDHPARVRLAFEEMLAHHLAAWQSRRRREQLGAVVIEAPGALWRRLQDNLGFDLTDAQRRAVAEIRSDLGRGTPAHRLVQGDVGSGKTLVAAAACLDVIECGHQAALMAPTEILSEQHVHNFLAWMQPLGVHVAVLLGRQGARERRAVLESMRTGLTQLAIGTHALFQEEVTFRDLALIVVDEQHRFGVMQRFALREKGRGNGNVPHQLTMTATPIPRSLAMSLYAEMDVTTIDELPPGRTPVDTVVLPESRREDVLARISGACARGEQVYWVCPVIDESEALEVQAATDTAATLAAALPEVDVGLVHGRMKNADKENVMQRFRRGDMGLLVATTVIEVGVDVPNASLMVIENAERLGLSQLHQLRGRVGRGARRSYCVLLYRPPLGEVARERLGIMKRSNDGFEIARKDLELRGPGELMGTRQTGLQQMMVADLLRDQPMLPMVRRAAGDIVERYPDRAERIIRRWIKNETELANV